MGAFLTAGELARGKARWNILIIEVDIRTNRQANW
jgi:hypothetical protein